MSSDADNAYLSCVGISLRWKDRLGLNHVDLNVTKNERLAILGENGAGKTTLLRVIAGLESASGSVLLEGKPIPAYADKESPVGMVFQRPVVYPHLSVRDNLSFPLQRRKKTKAEIEKRIRELSELLNLESLLTQTAATLSGGELQRVAIGRTLAHPPKVLLLDEPFANLHQTLRWQMVDYVRRLHREFSLTTILVTHEPGDAMYFADRIAVMGNGKILQIGLVEKILSEPASLTVAQLLFDPPPNVMNLENSTLAVWKPGDTAIGQPLSTMKEGEVRISGQVAHKGHYDNKILLSVTTEKGVFRAFEDSTNSYEIGETVSLNVDKYRIMIFPVEMLRSEQKGRWPLPVKLPAKY